MRFFITTAILIFVFSLQVKSVTFSGQVNHPDGYIAYSRMIIFDSETFEIEHIGNVCYGEEPFSLEIDPGIYNVYVRHYGPGNPTEFQNLDLTNDLDKDLLINTDQIESYTEWTKASKLVVFKGNGDNFYVEAKVGDEFNPDSFYLYNESGNFSDLSIQFRQAKFEMKDDGEGNDIEAGDGIYTSKNLSPDPDVELIRLGMLASAQLNKYQISIDGTLINFSTTGSITNSIGFVNSDYQSSEINKINDSIYYNDHVINIVREDHVWLVNADDEMMYDANTIYRHFPDEFDFLLFFARNKYSKNHVHFDVQTVSPNIGREDKDLTADYGSKGRLLGVQLFTGTSYTYPINHEILHQWSNHLTEVFPTAIGHHGYTSIYGVHGGFNIDDMTIISPTLVNLANRSATGGIASEGTSFCDLELYLMGLIDYTELRDEYVSLIDPEEESWTEFSVSSIEYITPQDIVDQYGERTPSVEDSQKDFTAAYVVLTNQPLSEAGFAFYSYLAQQEENSVEDNMFYQSFARCSDYKATMTTKLPDLLPVSVETVENNESIIYPNPSQNDFYVNISDINNRNLDIYVYSINGDLISSFRLESNRFGSKLLPGKYLIDIKEDDKTILSSKIIKSK